MDNIMNIFPFWSELNPADQELMKNALQIEKYNRSWNRFLFYPWGVWVTAYARKNLFSGIYSIGSDYIYSDTDSIKCINIEEHTGYINRYNEMCERKLIKMCDHYSIPYTALLPETIKGIIKPLGVWDHETKEHKYERFKTLGSKRYMVYQNGKLSITVSGVNKKTAVPYLLETNSPEECFDIFNEGLFIPPDQTGKLTHCYIDKEYKGVVTDYNGIQYNYNAPSGIYLEPAGYDFDISMEYIQFLKGYFYTK